MPTFDPTLLATWTGGSWTKEPDAPVTGFGADSRRLSKGQAFVALKTVNRDGHDFLGGAVAAGASAALVSRANPGVDLPQLVVSDPLAAFQAIAREHRRLFTGTVFAITGSAGKTSTKEILAILLGGDKEGVLATEANLNNQIGVALTLTRLDPARHRSAVIEAGISEPGEMAVLASMIEPDIALVTLVGPAHLQELGGLEGVAREKAALAGTLRPGGAFIYPSSCEAFAAFRNPVGMECIVLAQTGEAEGRGTPAGRPHFSLNHSAAATSVALTYGPPPPLALKLARVTDGMAQNVALAACAALRSGVRKDQMQKRLASWRPSALRGEWRLSEGRRLYLDCYNANPASMADALLTFSEVAPAAEPRMFVIGCMEELGAEAEHYHVELGRSLPVRATDAAIVVGSLAGAVRRGALEAGIEPAQVEIAESLDAVTARLEGFRGSVFVKGSRRHRLEEAFVGRHYAEASHA
jgi:UDP-N-acetylmuramoyl-tripeptide--D-alanyl-D-alanine ligase